MSNLADLSIDELTALSLQFMLGTIPPVADWRRSTADSNECVKAQSGESSFINI